MKKKLTVLLALLPLVCACSLDESRDTENFVSLDTFYQNKEQCKEALNGCYPMLRSIYNSAMDLALEGCSDLLFCLGSNPDGRLDISPSTPRRGQYVWQNCYLGIRNANLCIDRIPLCSKLGEDEIYEFVGEAKVLRAYYYCLLTSFFGDVPFYTMPVYTVDELRAVERMPRMSAVEIRDSLVSDLMDVLPHMKKLRTCETEGNRLRYSAGLMTAAKMAMWNASVTGNEAYWTQSAELLDLLEEVYGEFSEARYPLEDVKFCNANVPESIMEIQHSYTLGGLSYTSDLATICMPYPRGKESATYAGVEIPELGSMSSCYIPMRPTIYFLGLMPNNGRDRRYDMTMVWSWNGVKFKDTNTRPYLGTKFWYSNLQGAQDGNNYKILRYADAVLMKAECLCNLKQYDASAAYLNKIRKRAGLDDYVFISAERLMEEIRNERARELVGEFQRKFDLVRWGIWYEMTLSHNEQPYLLSNIKPCNRYYPIPDAQVALSGGALDNKEYQR